MSPHHPAVDPQVPHIRIGAEMGKESLENSVGLPSGKPLVNAVPFSILFR